MRLLPNDVVHAVQVFLPVEFKFWVVVLYVHLVHLAVFDYAAEFILNLFNSVILRICHHDVRLRFVVVRLVQHLVDNTPCFLQSLNISLTENLALFL